MFPSLVIFAGFSKYCRMSNSLVCKSCAASWQLLMMCNMSHLSAAFDVCPHVSPVGSENLSALSGA